MKRSTARVLAALTILAACVGSPRHADERRGRTTFTPTSASAEPSTRSRPTRAFELSPLPPQGIAIEHQGRHRRVVLLDLHGGVIEVLHGFSIGNHGLRPLGPLVVARGNRRYRLRPRRHDLVLMRRRRPGAEADGGRRFPLKALPAPTGSVISGEASGEWTSGVLSSDGNTVLAQWSGFVFGSCQTTATYLVTAEGGRPEPVTGSAPIEARPTSFVIGWTRSGRALAFLPGVGCAGREPVRPGVYRYIAPGEGTRIAGGNAASVVRMWGARAAARTEGAIRLREPLPRRGIAVERRGDVQLLSTVGRRLATLRGFAIDRATDRPGALVLVRGHERYLVRAGRSTITRIGTERAARLRRPDDPSVPLRPPEGSRVDGEVVGHWRWMQRASTGPRILAQWSGECEAPVALLGDAGALRPVTGEPSLRGAPESFALGWTPDGRAVVLLPKGACGSSAKRPGVYLFRSPGDGTLLVGTPSFSGARMWGAGSR